MLRQRYNANFRKLSESLINDPLAHCADCSKGKQTSGKFNRTFLDVHHLDGDKTNDEPTNLVVLCRRCHISLEALNRRIRRSIALRMLRDPAIEKSAGSRFILWRWANLRR